MVALTPPPAEARPVDPDRTACFSIVADPDPAALARLLEPFAKRGLVPQSVHSRLLEAEEELCVDLQVRALTREESEYIARTLRTVPLVRQVLTSERRSIRAAEGLAA